MNPVPSTDCRSDCDGRLAQADLVNGIVLAGGSSSRLGRNKALIQVHGRSMIERVLARLRDVVHRVVLVTNSPDAYAFLGLAAVPDIYPGVGTLGGLHAGLNAIDADYGLAVGCDMPLLNTDLLRYMLSTLTEPDRECPYDVVMPRIGSYFEPLHAIYARRCIPAFERSIAAGQRRILRACRGLRIRFIVQEEIARYDPEHLSFLNVNTHQDLAHIRSLLQRETRAAQV